MVYIIRSQSGGQDPHEGCEALRWGSYALNKKNVETFLMI